MRGLLAVIVVALVSWSSLAHADLKAANAANSRGYALHKKKKYPEAAVEYRKAIAADASHLLAHYNLACVASLTKDAATAKEQLTWIADRATWDTAALDVIKKTAPKDKDLIWIRKLDQEGNELASGMQNTELLHYDLADRSESPADVGKATTDAKLVKALAGAAGNHAATCSADTFATSGSSLAPSTALASLRDGVAVVDDKGAVIARTEPLGCTSAREQVQALAQADAPAGAKRLLVVQYTNRTEMKIAVFALTDSKKLVRAFEAELMGFDGTGALIQTNVSYKLVFTPAGKKPVVYRWNPTSTTYVAE